MNTSEIKEQMDVVCSCGAHIGRVDKIEGNTIKLAKHDANSMNHHHWIPLDWVTAVDEKVHLNRGYDETIRDWKAEPMNV